jgi:tRNA dimethylallyltransferase
LILYIVGPTAAGKTSAAIEIAEALGGEVVSLDSRQFYRGMDIGTAKPTESARRGVPHHLLDIADPSETVPLAAVAAQARSAAADIEARGALAILCGGTGQYVRALRLGWMVPLVAPDADLRAGYEREAEAMGFAAVHARLAAVDEVAAASIDPRNVRRVIRALEVYEATGTPFSDWRRKRTEPLLGPILGLDRRRSELFNRIDLRVAEMLAAGLEAEVRGLVGAGHGFDLPSMSGVGYGEWKPFFAGTAGVEDVSRAIRANTRRLVRKQSAWFRADDPDINWVDAAKADLLQIADTARKLTVHAPSTS